MSRIVARIASSVVLAVALAVVSAEANVIHNVNNDPHWTRITQPTVNRPLTRYDDVQIMPGDRVWVSAGGCVQTGGHGQTWKHYVRPQGSNSEYLYHGQIMIGGLFFAPTNFSDLAIVLDAHGFTTTWSEMFTVANCGGSAFPDHALYLGFTDDNYGDNGYYSHDDGNNDQCKYVGDAYVDIYILHPGE